MIREPLDYNFYKSILCLNGELPCASFFNTTLPIIAADGAANSLDAMNILPNMIIGDLDSVSPHLLKKTDFLQRNEQNSNDYEKAMKFLENQHLLPAIVVGINGGYLDHVLNNINIFMNYNCFLYAPPLKGFVASKGETISLTLPLSTKISLLGIPQAKVSTNGLKWELNSAILSYPGANSCFNRTCVPEIELIMEEGKILVLIYENTILDAGN